MKNDTIDWYNSYAYFVTLKNICFCNRWISNDDYLKFYIQDQLVTTAKTHLGNYSKLYELFCIANTIKW